MTWNTDLRDSNPALIGYTNGDGTYFLEIQNNYRPDNRTQTGATSKNILPLEF